MWEVSRDCRFSQFRGKKKFLFTKKKSSMIYLGSSYTEKNQIETGCLLQASPADLGDAQNSRNWTTASGEILEFFYLVCY